MFSFQTWFSRLVGNTNSPARRTLVSTLALADRSKYHRWSDSPNYPRWCSLVCKYLGEGAVENLLAESIVSDYLRQHLMMIFRAHDDVVASLNRWGNRSSRCTSSTASHQPEKKILVDELFIRTLSYYWFDLFSSERSFTIEVIEELDDMRFFDSHRQAKNFAADRFEQLLFFSTIN